MKFDVTTEEATLIMVALGHMSFNKVAGLIVKLQTQSNHQTPTQEPEPKSPVKVAEEPPVSVKTTGKAGKRKIKLTLASSASTEDSLGKIAK